MRVLVTKLQKVERVAFAPEGTHLFASGLHDGSLGYGAPDSGIDAFDLNGGAEPSAVLFAGRDIRWFAPLSCGRLVAAHSLDFDAKGPSATGVTVLNPRAARDPRLDASEWQVGAPCGASASGHRLITVLSGEHGFNCRGQHAREQGVGGWALPEDDEERLDWEINVGYDRSVQALALGSDGRSFWTAEHVTSRTPPTSRIEFVPRGADTGSPLREPVPYPNQNIAGLALAETFAVAHDGPTLFAYDLANLAHKPKKVSNPAKGKHFTGFAIHPSGKWLAAAGLDGAVTLWDTAGWNVARSWVWDVGQARSVCFSADGTLAAVGTNTGKIVVWDLDL